MTTSSQAPRPADLLYEHVFDCRHQDDIVTDLSLGISACITNAARLLKDVQLLVEAERYASATFLSTTAREELSKVYILTDACRLDFSRHQSVLRKLCKAFYDHIAKHAYYKVHSFPTLISMDRVKLVWEAEVTRWWPGGGPESGEPNMPHATYFQRELPLYVNFSDYSDTWILPEDGSHRFLFDESYDPNPLILTAELLERMQKSEKIGLLSIDSLALLNSVFRVCYVNDRTPLEEVGRLHTRVATQIETAKLIPCSEVLASPLTVWPLYHFI
jgi:AbiV family abortive infection protein